MGVNLFDESETLCFWVLIKKHVFLYHYFQGQFKLFKEIPLNDTPLLMSWTGDYINLQFKDHIMCLNIHTNQSVADFKTQVKNTNQMCMKLLQSQNLLVATSNNILFPTISLLFFLNEHLLILVLL